MGISARPPVGFNYFKIVDSGSAVVNKPVNIESVENTVSHNLPKPPFLIAFYVDSQGGFVSLPVTLTTTDGGGTSSPGLIKLSIVAYSSANLLHFQVNAPNIGGDESLYAASFNVIFYYYFVEESAQTT